MACGCSGKQWPTQDNKAPAPPTLRAGANPNYTWPPRVAPNGPSPKP